MDADLGVFGVGGEMNQRFPAGFWVIASHGIPLQSVMLFLPCIYWQGIFYASDYGAGISKKRGVDFARTFAP